MSGSDGNTRGLLGSFSDSLENRFVMLFAAALLGMGGNLAIVKTTKDARHDPFTGADADAFREEITEEISDKFSECRSGLRDLRRDMIAHRERGAHGVAHQRLTTLEQEVDRLRDKLFER